MTGGAGSGGEPAGPSPAGSTADRAPDPAPDELNIRLPAQSVYLGILRTAITGLAAQCDYTVDEIEDLRIAVDEATAMLLARSSSTSFLDCHFEIRDGGLVAQVRTAVDDTTPPDTASFGWLVLNALAGSVNASFDGDQMTIELSRPRPTTVA